MADARPAVATEVALPRWHFEVVDAMDGGVRFVGEEGVGRAVVPGEWDAEVRRLCIGVSD